MEGGLEYRCERCGAPLDVSPETIVAVCPYCGYPNHISGTLKAEDVWIVPSLGRDRILRAFEERLRRDMDMRLIAKDVEVFDVEGYYAPYWVGRIPVEGHVEYYVLTTRTRGKSTTIEKKHYREDFSETRTTPLSARRQVVEFGVKELVEHYLKHPPKHRRLADLSREEWEEMKIPVLNTELDEREAEIMVKDDACDSMRAYYASKADGVEYFNCVPGEPEELRLVLLPIWTVYYRYKNAVYRVVFSGWDARDVAATEPVTILRKAAYMAGMITAPFIAGASFMVHSSGIVLGGLLAGILLAYGSAKALLKGARVEEGV